MIEKMTRYTFVLMSQALEGFLASIQQVGLLDITRSQKPVDEESSSLLEEIGALSSRISDIENDRFTRDSQYVAMTTEKAELSKLLADAQPWGRFDADALKKLGDLGLRMRFYCVPSKKFDPAWEQAYALTIVEDNGKDCRFVTVGPTEGYEFPVAETPAPKKPCSDYSADMEKLDARISAKVAELTAEKETLPQLRSELAGLTDKLSLYLAGKADEKAAEGYISIVTGFAPTVQDTEVKDKLDKLGVLYMADPAVKEDNPPIKLKNNWFARQFESLTGMYGMPVYDEWDPTPVLAPFFLLFFALCMGDAGYGIVLTAFAYAIKGLKNGGPMGLSGHWRLLRSLGIGTFVVGIILGTFFGIDMYKAAWVPEALKGIMLKGKVAGFDVQMVAALGIGVVHICLAMFIKALLYTQRFGAKHAVSVWGWVLLIVGSLATLGIGMLSGLDAEIIKYAIIGIAAVSCLAIFVFNTPGRNPLINVGAGLWDTYQMATGLLGDVLSYIRLYALGLAGGMLGDAFNTIGGLILGQHPTWQFLPFLIVVLIGHTLNFAMSCLGAYVHPLRLTFVEYFKNSGYEGKGSKFAPFRTMTTE